MTDQELVTLAPGALARIVPGAPFADRPEIWLNNPAVVLRAARVDTASEPSETVGSREWLWETAEGWRFDARTGGLALVAPTLPEVDANDSQLVAGWSQVPVTTGTLEMLDPHDFLRPDTAVRWSDPLGHALFGFYDPTARTDGVRRRVRLAEDTHLLVIDGELIGWSIDRPARFITGEGFGALRPQLDEVSEERLTLALGAFFGLVTEENVDRLEAGDTAVRDALGRLDEQLDDLCDRHEPRALEIRTKIRQVIEDYAT